METIYSKKTVAEKLGISTKTLDRRIFEGELAHIKMGRLVLVRECDLEDYLNRCRHPALCEKNGGVA